MEKVSHVLVCLNVDCKSRGAVEVMQELSRRLAAKGCNGVAVKSYMCFGACQAGPNLVLHPQHTWYSGVKVDDLDEIVNHILGGPVVERLADKVDPSLRMLIYQLLDAGLF